MKTDTMKDRENLDKAISFAQNQNGTSMYSLQLSRHANTKWLTGVSPYIPDALVPAPHLGFVQLKGLQSFSIG
jgi:hypothetical protein